ANSADAPAKMNSTVSAFPHIFLITEPSCTKFSIRQNYRIALLSLLFPSHCATASALLDFSVLCAEFHIAAIHYYFYRFPFEMSSRVEVQLYRNAPYFYQTKKRSNDDSSDPIPETRSQR